MSRKYGTGLQLVLATIVISSAIIGFGPFLEVPGASRAAQDLGTSARPIGPFRLEERSGRTVTAEDLSGRVAIASFIFTRCPLSCPRITSVMKALQGRLEDTDVLLVSFSVDPEHDTQEVLRKYANTYGASPDRWWFLTGPKAAIYDLIQDRFQLGVMEAPGPVSGDTESILHSDRLALIDHGRIVGLFDSTDRRAVSSLTTRARRLSLPAWVTRLPSVNAVLNGISACLLFAGWVLIRRYRREATALHDPPTLELGPEKGPVIHPFVRGHITCMIAAVCTSALFLACYLYYHHRAGSMPFSQGGRLRFAYLSILLSHTLLAVLSVPLILVTLRRGWAGRYDRHVSIASLTLPIWLYVAITGVVIYLMLYHLPVGPIGMSPG